MGVYVYISNFLYRLHPKHYTRLEKLAFLLTFPDLAKLPTPPRLTL